MRSRTFSISNMSALAMLATSKKTTPQISLARCDLIMVLFLTLDSKVETPKQESKSSLQSISDR